MNDSILDKQIVLKLNSAWQRLGYCTPRQAFVSLCGGAYGGTPPALAMNIELDESGAVTSIVPTKWEDWVNLPVRPQDLAIGCHLRPVRCPVVILIPSYSKVPVKGLKLTNRGIHERDGFIDQYTGEKLSPHEASVDHVIPKDRGGTNSWENMVSCRKDRNHKKGNRLNHEVGLNLIRRPKAPRAIPISETIKTPRHPHQTPFFK